MPNMSRQTRFHIGYWIAANDLAALIGPPAGLPIRVAAE
jgi:hypothetical protein